MTRGLWLIVLELTVFRCIGFQFNVDYRMTLLVILWALGWSMITLSALVHLPVAAVTVFGVALIALHNMFDPVSATWFGAFAPLWSVLHQQNVIVNTPRFVVFVAYPLVPWIGVSAAGYGLGQVFTWEPERRRRFLLCVGLALTVTFVVLRYANVYGDPVRWSTHASGVRTLLSFLNANKQPPSLLYLLMTVGPALLMLWMLDGGTPRLLTPALTFGKVPFFYFMLHLPLIHLLAVAVCYRRYGEAHWMFESPSLAQYPFTRPPGWEYSLPVVYAIWMGVVLALYPLCAWFAGVKQRRRDWWLGYL